MNGKTTYATINSGIDGNHLIGKGGLPTVILGSGAGAGSYVITGNDTAFTISVTAGAGTVNNSIIFTLTFNTPFSSLPHSVFSPGSKSAAPMLTRVYLNNNSVNSFDFRITNPALVSGTTYTWHIITIG